MSNYLYAWVETLRATIETAKEKGQGTVEYALVMGVIVVAVITAMLTGAPAIDGIITAAIEALNGLFT